MRPQQKPHALKKAPLVATALALLAAGCVAPGGRSAMKDGFRGRVILIGDSLSDNAAWPVLVRQAIKESGGRPPVFINAAAGGDSAGDCLARFDEYVMPHEFDAAIVFCTGGNDMAKKRAPEQFESDVDAMVVKLRGRNVPVFLVTGRIAGPRHQSQPDRDARSRYHAALRRISRRRGCIAVDVEKAMSTAWSLGIWLWEPDQSHLNLDGNKVVARCFLDALGYPDVAVPAELNPEPLPGLVKEWRIKAVEDNAAPLDETGAAALKPDETWKALVLPEAEPQQSWWFEQIRREGFALSLEKLAGPARRYLGAASVFSASDADAWLNTGGHLQSVWLNNRRVYLNNGRWAGFHAGRERIPVHLNAETNSIIIETGPQFSLNISETRYW